jgi:hypothetical protein
MLINKPHWHFVQFDLDRKIIFIADANDGSCSVTNGAEQVCKEVAYLARIRNLMGGDPYRLFYRDTEGQWDELVLDDNGQFVGFKFGNGIVPSEFKYITGENHE